MRRRLIVITTILTLLLAAAGVIWAQVSVHYDLTWNVVSAGGQPMSSTHFALSGTTGQALGDNPGATSANYTIRGGFWQVPRFYQVFIPAIDRNASY